MSEGMNQLGEWRRKRFPRTHREWIRYAGLALLLVVTAVVVATAFGR